MKNMKRMLALLLALAMVFCLAACGAKGDGAEDKKDEGSSNVTDTKKDEPAKEEDDKASDEDKLAGEWTCRLDLSETVNTVVGEMMDGEDVLPDAPIYMDMTIEFDDGECALTGAIDEGSFNDYIDALVDAMIDYMYDAAEAEGMSKEEFDQQIQDEAGMSMEEYMDETMSTMMDEMGSEMSFESGTMYYKVDSDEGRIYMAEDEADLEDTEDYMEYSVTNKKLTIKKIVEDGEDSDAMGLEAYGIELPWEFEK